MLWPGSLHARGQGSASRARAAAQAINRMNVRGAPAIAITAALALAAELDTLMRGEQDVLRVTEKDLCARFTIATAAEALPPPDPARRCAGPSASPLLLRRLPATLEVGSARGEMSHDRMLVLLCRCRESIVSVVVGDAQAVQHVRVRLQYLKTSRPTAVNLSEAVARLTAARWALT